METKPDLKYLFSVEKIAHMSGETKSVVLKPDAISQFRKEVFDVKTELNILNSLLWVEV